MKRKGKPKRSPFFRFVRSEILKNIRRPSFFGFLGILSLIQVYTLYSPMEFAPFPIQNVRQIGFSFAGMICSFYFAFLVLRNFTHEFEKRTMNILVTTPLSKEDIFLGKIISILLLSPFVILVMAVFFLLSILTNGTPPQFEIVAFGYNSLLLALYCTCIAAFTMVLSVAVRRTAPVAILIIIFVVMSLPIGMTAVDYNTSPPTVNYVVQFLLPYSAYNIGTMFISQYMLLHWGLIIMQVLFVFIFLTLGLVLFRRSQLWG